MEKWSAKDWLVWRVNNLRLAAEGWTLGTDVNIDGTIYDYAEKDGVRITRATPGAWEIAP